MGPHRGSQDDPATGDKCYTVWKESKSYRGGGSGGRDDFVVIARHNL